MSGSVAFSVIQLLRIRNVVRLLYLRFQLAHDGAYCTLRITENEAKYVYLKIDTFGLIYAEM